LYAELVASFLEELDQLWFDVVDIVLDLLVVVGIEADHDARADDADQNQRDGDRQQD